MGALPSCASDRGEVFTWGTTAGVGVGSLEGGKGIGVSVWRWAGERLRAKCLREGGEGLGRVGRDGCVVVRHDGGREKEAEGGQGNNSAVRGGHTVGCLSRPTRSSWPGRTPEVVLGGGGGGGSCLLVNREFAPELPVPVNRCPSLAVKFTRLVAWEAAYPPAVVWGSQRSCRRARRWGEGTTTRDKIMGSES